jgi:phospholipase/carboxylesterase
MPRALRGMVFHSGYLPALSLSELPPNGLAGKGFFVGHGLYDDLVAVESGRAAAAVFQQQGASVVYREYPIDHSIGEESLYELSEWLTNELDSHE